MCLLKQRFTCGADLFGVARCKQLELMRKVSSRILFWLLIFLVEVDNASECFKKYMDEVEAIVFLAVSCSHGIFEFSLTSAKGTTSVTNIEVAYLASLTTFKNQQEMFPAL